MYRKYTDLVMQLDLSSCGYIPTSNYVAARRHRQAVQSLSTVRFESIATHVFSRRWRRRETRAIDDALGETVRRATLNEKNDRLGLPPTRLLLAAAKPLRDVAIEHTSGNRSHPPSGRKIPLLSAFPSSFLLSSHCCLLHHRTFFFCLFFFIFLNHLFLNHLSRCF